MKLWLSTLFSLLTLPLLGQNVTPIHNLAHTNRVTTSNEMAAVVRPNATNGTMRIFMDELLESLKLFPGWPIPAPGTGEANTGTNLTVLDALRFGLFAQKTGLRLDFYGLEQGTNVILYFNGSNVVLNAQPVGNNGIATSNGKGTNTALSKLSVADFFTNTAANYFFGGYRQPYWTNAGSNDRIALIDSNQTAILTFRYDPAGLSRILYLNDVATGLGAVSIHAMLPTPDATHDASFNVLWNDGTLGTRIRPGGISDINNLTIVSNRPNGEVELGNTTGGVYVRGANVAVKSSQTNEQSLTVRAQITTIATNGTQASLFLNSHSNAFSQILFQKARDIEATPGQVLAGDVLGNLEFLGRGTANYRTSFSIKPQALTDFTSTSAETLVLVRVGNNSGSARIVMGFTSYNWTNSAQAWFESNVTFSAGVRLPGLTADRLLQLNGAGDITNSPMSIAVTFSGLSDGQGLIWNAAMGRWTNGAVGGSGEVNVGSNLGGAFAWYAGKSGVTLQFNTLSNSDSSILISSNGNTLQISATNISTAKLQDGAVTLAKHSNMATDRLVGRDTPASGPPEELTVGGGIEFTGSGGIQRSALTGDVTASAGSGTTAIAAGVVGTTALANNSVTYAKLQDVTSTQRFIGRNTAAAGDPEEFGISAGLDWLSSTRGNIIYRGANSWTNLPPGTAGQLLQSGGPGADPSWVNSGVLTDGDKTDIIVSGGTTILTIDNQAVSNAKFRDSAGLSVVGRSANFAGSVADITAAADGQVLRRNGTTIGFGALDFTSANAISGVIPRANIPSQLAFEDEANAFNLQQTFSGPFATISSNITGTDIDWSLNTLRDKTLSAPTTFTFSQLADNRWLRIKLQQDGTGGRTATWPAGIVWINATNQSDAPTIAQGANAITFVTLLRQNGTIQGWTSGPDSIPLVDFANITGLTKGDLFVWSGTHFVRQLVGSDGQVLQANSSSSNGLAWASTGAGIIRIETNNATVGNQTNVNVSAQNATVYATNNAASNKIDLLIVASTNNPVEATGVHWITNQIYYVPQEFNGSNGTAATQTNFWDMSQKTFKAITNFMGCSNTFIVTNVQQSSALISTFIGLGAVGTASTNNVFVQAAAGVNIKWMNWATNTDGTATDIKVRAGYTYVVQMWADRATNVNAWVSTDDPYNPLSIVTFSAFTAGISNLVASNAVVRAGASSSNATVGGAMFFSNSSLTNNGQTSAIFTNLLAYTVPAHTLTNNGDAITAIWRGRTLVGSNTLNLLYGSTTNVFGSTAITNLGGANWEYKATITRTGQTSQHVDAVISWEAEGIVARSLHGNVEIAETNGVNTLLTLQTSSLTPRTGANTLTNNYLKIVFEPASR
jgi:hypothetical protein